jgi:hypothetical protein
MDRRLLSAAASKAANGDLKLSQLAYAAAAEYYRQATELVPARHEEQRLVYLDREAHALFGQGAEGGDTQALVVAIERYQLLRLRPREESPLDWARTQCDLTLALRIRSEQTAGTALVHEALKAFRQALLELTRDRFPFDWARTQISLSTVLSLLGQREGDPVRLEKARG